MRLERTLFVLKPESSRRGKIGRIITRFTNLGLRIIAMREIKFDEALVNRQYGNYGVPIIWNVCRSLTRGYSFVMVVEGPNVLEIGRKIIGFYKPHSPEHKSGTIRGRYMSSLYEGSIMHASDSYVDFRADLGRLFPHYLESEEFYTSVSGDISPEGSVSLSQ